MKIQKKKTNNNNESIPHNILYLENIFNEIHKCEISTKYNMKIKNNNDISRSKTICLLILKIIINNLLKGNTKTAYDIFTTNFAKNNHFDNILICWIRIKLYEKLQNKSHVLYNGFISLDDLAKQDYYGVNAKNYSDYLRLNILNYGEEGETLTRYILPVLLGINVHTIIWDPKNKYKVSDDGVFYKDVCFDDSDFISDIDLLGLELKLGNVFILRRDNHYDILYTKGYIDEKYDFLNSFFYLKGDKRINILELVDISKLFNDFNINK